MSHPEFLGLLSVLMDRRLSDAEMAQLEQHLHEHPQARQLLVDHLFLDALLGNEVGTESVANLVDMVGASEPAAAPLRLLKPHAPARWRWAVGLAAAILVLVAATAAVV